MAATFAGIVMAYDSYTWPPSHSGWPVSFFVVVLVLVAYLLAQLKGRDERRPRSVEAGRAIGLARDPSTSSVGQR
jgi:zinc/manganese transport system permease protein